MKEKEITKMMEKIGTAYVNILKDDKGETLYKYGYELNEKEVSLKDIAMLVSFINQLKTASEYDFEQRLQKNDKEFSIEK